MRKSTLFGLAIALVVAACGNASLAAGQTGAAGVFVDRDGGRHHWRISETRALMWDEQAYLPAGAVFTSAYLSSQTDDDWQKDATALASLKSAGVTDVLVRGAGAATAFPAPAWQKLIDHLEAQGFSYGVELDDGPATRAQAIVVCPRKYKLPKVTQPGQLTLDLPRAQGGFFVTADPATGATGGSGYLRAANDKATIKLNVGEGESPTLLLFPFKEISTGRGSMPDLWQGADEYRDRLIDTFDEVKFGQGFRFFYSPLTAGVIPVGDSVNAIPNSQSFRVEFEGWLSLKYQDPEALYRAWGITHFENPSYEQAARLIPLWWDGRGLGSALDRATDTFYEVDLSNSAMWRDILDFRNSSIRQAMDAIADALKRCAQAPVVFPVDSYHAIFTNGPDDGGFDGLSATVASDSDADTAGVGQAYALTFDARKIMWFVGMVTPGADPSETPRALARLKDLGAKGFFVQAGGAGAVTEFKKQLDTTAADYAPDVLFYPFTILSGARVKKIDQQTWWLPTLRNGQLLQLGDNIFGYSLVGDIRSPAEAMPAPGSDKQRQVSGDGVALWCNKGTIKATIRLQGQAAFHVSEANKTAAQISGKKDVLTLQLSENPVVIYGLPAEQLFPIEVAESQIEILQDAVTEAAKAGVNVSGYAASIQQTKGLLADFHPSLAYQSASAKLRALGPAAIPYIWIEAETAKDHNFDGSAAREGCSGAQYLKLSTPDDPPIRQYFVNFTFSSPSDGSYALWLAAAPPGNSGISNLEYSVDGGDWQAVTPTNTSAPYVDVIAWFKVGNVSLAKGQHSLGLQVSRSSPDAPYYTAIDALLLTKQAFTPNGAERPPIGGATRRTKR